MPQMNSSGWRAVTSDGKSLVDGDVFIAMNRFSVAEGQEAAFEERFAARESELSTHDA